jgi:hypothetical protein
MTLVRIDVTEERITSVMRVERSSELVTANVVLSSLTISTLMMEEIPPSETSVITRSTQRHIPEDGILQNLC